MKWSRYVLALATLVLTSDEARADGGVMRLHETQGPFVVTIYTAGEPMQDAPVDVSVLVQERDSDDAILDASVNLVFTPAANSPAHSDDQICGEFCGSHSIGINVPATRAQSSNKLLYAAPVKFSASGEWQLQGTIERAGKTVNVACNIPVGSPSPPWTSLTPLVAVPPFLVAVFALNQRLRKIPPPPAGRVMVDWSGKGETR